MNYKMIKYLLAIVVACEGILLFLPFIVALIYKEPSAMTFFLCAFATLITGFCLAFNKPKNTRIYAKEGFVIVAFSWLLISIIGALPFYVSGAIPSFIDCIFETASGFTTTGASILTEIESLPKGILFWRSFTHWLGGMGVLVFILAILPLAGGRSMHLMRAESPGPSVGKLVPHLRDTAKILYVIYLALTVAETIVLLLVGMPLYDSIVHAFGTAGTGGFSIKNASIAAYDSPAIEWVITVFMILFGVNFSVFYMIMVGSVKKAFKSEEARWYFSIIAVSILVITLNIRGLFTNLSDAIRAACFQVGSIITTTGYATADFNLWPEFSKSLLVLLMLVGACAGSTGGGLKVSRLIILIKSSISELRTQLSPRRMTIVTIDKKPISEDTVKEVRVYFFIYIFITLCSILLISVDSFSFETTVTAVVACINNIGPGLGMVGATGNYSQFSDFSKMVLTLNMLIGRLEIYPMLMLLAPRLWKIRVKNKAES